jgi:PhzF family phenazine biosynthesis protein
MEILKYAAFTNGPLGGNPAGVVLDAGGLSDEQMQAIAAQIGFSETAFMTSREGETIRVRYFSPLAEVPFCGHATIAAAVAHAKRFGAGELVFDTNAGQVTTSSETDATGATAATLVSVAPRTKELTSKDLDALLIALRWPASDLDASLPARVAYAGAWHPVLAAKTRDRLARLDYDFNALGQLMAEREWTTIQLVWRESETVFHSRNPFPPGGVIEDPATGAAAAALGGYLREFKLVHVPTRLIIHQGDDLGRPGLLEVSVPAELTTGIAVSGYAVPLSI